MNDFRDYEYIESITNSIVTATQVATNQGNADLNFVQKGTRYKVR